MIDTSEVMLNFLLDQPALVALVDERIHAEAEMPPGEWSPIEGACICFKRRGGSHDEEAVVLSPSVQFKVYGAEGAPFQTQSPQASANDVYGVLFDVLNYAGSGQILGAEQEAQGQLLREPDTGWWYVLVSYRLQILN